jgi:mRNA-degrading endonuclease toxin of MazEF toxin-antitoxin module
MCPITTRQAPYRRDLDVSIPPEVTIRNKNSIGFIKLIGVVQADHIKSLDWFERAARYAGDMPNDTVNQVLQIVGTLVKIWDVEN